jgi:hypothetical protein
VETADTAFRGVKNIKIKIYKLLVMRFAYRATCFLCNDGRAPAFLPLGPEQLISTREELFHFSKMLLTSSLFFTYRAKLRLRDFSHYSLCTILKEMLHDRVSTIEWISYLQRVFLMLMSSFL